MRPLIDADSIVYRAATGCKDFIQALEYANFLIEKCEERFLMVPLVFLGGKTNFRYAVDPTYKAHRKRLEKPKFYEGIREYLVMEWKAEIIEGYEVDDVLGVMADSFSVMCSIDKDLDTIPGAHYNFIKDDFYEVSEDQAAYYFWKQVLMGDSVDNVQGIKGIGEKKAVKLLKGLDVKDYKKAVLDAYLTDEKKRDVHKQYSEKELEDRAFEAFDRTARLIFIKRGRLESEYYDYY